MSNGYTRIMIAGLFMGIAALADHQLDDYHLLSPNEIADHRIRQEERVQLKNIEQALTQQTGPTYDEAITTCKKEEKKLGSAKASISFVTNVLETASGKKITFDSNKCLQRELNLDKLRLLKLYLQKDKLMKLIKTKLCQGARS